MPKPLLTDIPTPEVDSSIPAPDDLLRVAITFRRPNDALGLSELEGPLDLQAVRDSRPNQDQMDQAAAVLQGLGLEVTARGRMSLSATCARATFDRVFSTAVVPRPVQTLASSQVSGASFYDLADDASSKPAPELAPLIDNAFIQPPHIYFFNPPSPLPPRVDYHHLRVPSDVCLLLNVDPVHRSGCTGRGVRVAMIDSGFNHAHPHFTGRGYQSNTVLAPGAVDAAVDTNGHGTAESANLLAVAPGVDFIGVKLDNDRTGSGATLLEGFQIAMQQDPQVVSISLGFDLVQSPTRRHAVTLPPSYRPLEAEIEDAIDRGVVVVAAAGNGHVAFPGMMPDVLSAGGAYVARNCEVYASDYASAFTSKIYPGRIVPDFCGLVGLAHNSASYIMLPVEKGCSLDRRSDGTAMGDGWAVISGTSAAAPQIAGVCALLLQRNAGLTPSDIRGLLARNARDVSRGTSNAQSNEGRSFTAHAGQDPATGSGLVDAFKAWQNA